MSLMTAPNPTTTASRDELEALVAATRRGEASAFRQIYERCVRRVFGLAVRMVGREDAADVTQQSFLQLYRQLDQFRGGASFETWLYRVVVNESLQHLRQRKRKTNERLVAEPSDQRVTSGHRMEQAELLELALQRLDPELRSLFLLREREGLSYRELADTLGIPEGTIGSRLNRARQELQQHLRGLGWE